MKYGFPSCFSGECDMCDSCNGNFIPDESMRYTMDKFFDRGKMTDEYWRTINDISKKYLYKNPTNCGFLGKKKFHYGYDCPNRSDNQIYRLVETIQDNHCDSLTCKIIYDYANKQDQIRKFPLIPIYKREGTYPHHICGVCIENEAGWKK